jgi:hypothetical protein
LSIADGVVRFSWHNSCPLLFLFLASRVEADHIGFLPFDWTSPPGKPRCRPPSMANDRPCSERTPDRIAPTAGFLGRRRWRQPLSSPLFLRLLNRRQCRQSHRRRGHRGRHRPLHRPLNNGGRSHSHRICRNSATLGPMMWSPTLCNRPPPPLSPEAPLQENENTALSSPSPFVPRLTLFRPFR